MATALNSRSGVLHDLIILGCVVLCCILSAGCRREGSKTIETAGTEFLMTPESLPDWAQPGRLRCTRWDGGPLEAEKGRLTEWPYYTSTDEQRVMEAVRNWYDLRTIEFLKAGHFNWVWVTWSNGFSLQTERPQWEQLRKYIDECHKNGIKVTAYDSISNMFWEDMLQNEPLFSPLWVATTRDGIPIYHRFPHRLNADISRPDWLSYSRTRIQEALAAGADGFWIDNTSGGAGLDNVRRFLAEISQEASKVGRKIVLLSNYNRSIYTWARYQNGVATEDGREPGYYPTDPQDERLVTNAGLLRYQVGISEGWRPVTAEYGGRHGGKWRMLTPMEPKKWQLSLAESAAFQAALQTYFEGTFQRDLYFGNPKALENLKAIGQYNQFLQENENYYTSPQSVAKLAIISDTSDRIVPLLNDLAAMNVQFDILFNYQEPDLPTLKKYTVVLLPNTNPVSERLCANLAQFTRQGGTLIAVGDASVYPGPGETRNDFGLAEVLGVSLRKLPKDKTTNLVGSGKAIYYPAYGDIARVLSIPDDPSWLSLNRNLLADLGHELKSLAGSSETLSVHAPPTVLYNVVRQAEPRRLVLHLLNYAQEPTFDITVEVRAPVGHVESRSPDVPGVVSLPVKTNGTVSTFEAPRLVTYSLISIDAP
jgi:hypothetical protein